MARHAVPLAELRALFRNHPAFRRVFLADLATQFGDGAMLVAFPMVIEQRTHDLTLTGLSFSGEILTFGLLSQFAGYWADRLDQKLLMIVANLARVVLFAVLLFGLRAGWGLVAFLAVSGALGAAGAFFMPARAAFMRRLLEGDALQEAIALEGTVGFLMRLIAPPLMALLLAVRPATIGIQTDMLAYALAVSLLAPGWVRGRVLPVAEDPGRAAWLEGWRAIGRSAELRALLALDTLLSMVGTAAFAITVAFLEQVLHLGAQQNGFLLATTGLAGAIGTRFARRLNGRAGLYPLVAGAIALTYLLVPYAASLVALLLFWSLRGLAYGVVCVVINQRIAESVEAEVMGRVQAAWGLGPCLAAFVGSALTPVLLRYAGAAHAFTLLGSVLAVFALGLGLAKTGQMARRVLATS